MSANRSNEYLNERVAVLEENIETLQKDVNAIGEKIGKINENNIILARLEVILDQQVKANESQTKALEKIDSNITLLNTSQMQMQHEIKVMGNRLEYVEKTQEEVSKSSDRGKFDMTEFLAKDLPKLILVAIVLSLLAMIGLK